MPFFCLVTKVPSIDARELWMEDLEAEKSDMLQQFLGHLLFFASHIPATIFFFTPRVCHLEIWNFVADEIPRVWRVFPAHLLEVDSLARLVP